VALPETAKQAEQAQADARVKTAKNRWNEAPAEQRSIWLKQMDDMARKLAPSEGKEPGFGFLSCLVRVLEPELAFG
jgi:hypothetical protein